MAWRLGVACWLALSLPMRSALAAPEGTRQVMGFVQHQGWVTVQAHLNGLFGAKDYDALGSGFATVVVVRVWVLAEASGETVAFSTVVRRAVYDLWEDTYHVSIEDGANVTSRKIAFRAEALKLLTSLQGLAVVPVGRLAPDARYRVAMVAELNPVSPNTLAEARRWLGQGGDGPVGGGSLFGSFVSVFVNVKMASAAGIVRYVSQPFFVPKQVARE